MLMLCKVFGTGLLLALLLKCAHALKEEDEKYLEAIFTKVLGDLSSPQNRDYFRNYCARKVNPLCPRKWFFSKKTKRNFFKPGETQLKKERFYQTYYCYKFKQVKLCPVDGSWGAWTKWSKCGSKCGLEGSQNRTRSCNNPAPLRFGNHCNGTKVDSRTCKRHCKKEVTSRKEARTYLNMMNHAFPKLKHECRSGHCTYDDLSHYLSGKEKEKYWASMHCIYFDRECPVDGGWSHWTEWTSCQPVCGWGYRHRERSCNKPAPKNGGYQCLGSAYQNHQCFGTDCTKADLIYGHHLSDWSEFTPCSVSCGKYGIQVKKRICLKPYHCTHQLGKNVNKIKIIKPCYQGECPVKGGWSSWQKVNFCSARCGTGRKLKIRLCNLPFPTGSASCIGNEVETSICKGPCDDNWNNDVKDFKRTGSDMKIGPKSEDTPATGDRFSIPLIKSRETNYTQWSEWTPCTKSCEGGFRWRERACKLTGKCSGEIFQRQMCNTAKCPVQGGWTDWMGWSVCSVTCGPGVQTRYRKCDNPYPQAGGTCAEFSSEKRKCDTKPCKKTHFRYGEWSSWSNCSHPCGQKGTRVRTRGCVILPKGEVSSVHTQRLIKETKTPTKQRSNVPQSLPADKKQSSGGLTDKKNHSPVKHGKRKETLPYEDYLQTRYNAKQLAERQKKTTKIVKQISPGRNKRSRRRSAYLLRPKNSNLPADAKVLRKCSAHGTKMVSRCNVRNCPVDGKWANWGSWTKCSQTCGQGIHLRERTCTDPFPNGGKICDGSGTEIAHCFREPCSDPENKGVHLHNKSYLTYKAHRRATPFLLLYVLFKPEKDSGVMVRRYRHCSTGRCAHEFELSLDNGQPWLEVSDGKYKLNLKYPNKIKKNIWHTIMVCIFKKRAFMRVDDGKHLNTTVKCKGELNFDAEMTVGWDKHRKERIGFTGVIGSLRVNFRAVSLFEDASKSEYGAPIKSIDVKEKQLEPTVAYPIFHGNNYMKLSVLGTTRFSVEIVFSPMKMDGLLLFNHGVEAKSVVYLKIKKAVLVFCFNCGKKMVCTDLTDIQPDSWYHISLAVRKTTAKLRVNAGPSIELESYGSSFSPGRTLYVGGGERADRYQLHKDVQTTVGFMGYIYSLRINGQRVDMKGAAIMNKDGFLNSMGVTYSASDIIRESERSDVLLKCDYTYYIRKSIDVDVMWFKTDEVIYPNENGSFKIHQRFRGQPYTSGLELFGKGHSGIYLCAVHHAGVMVVQHAFIIEEPLPKTQWTIVKEEEMGVRIVAAIVPLLFLACLCFVCGQKVDAIRKSKMVRGMAKVEKLRKEKEKTDQERALIVDANQFEDADEDTSNVNTPRDDDTSNLNSIRDEDTSNVTTPRDRGSGRFSPHNEDDEKGIYDTIADMEDNLYDVPQGNPRRIQDKQVYFQEFDNMYERPQTRYEDYPVKDEEENKEMIDEALDAIIQKASKGSVHQRESLRRRSREDGSKQMQSEDEEGDVILRSDNLSRTTYLDTLKKRREANMQDRSIHAVITASPQGNRIYETRGTSVRGLSYERPRDTTVLNSDDINEQDYYLGANAADLYVRHSETSARHKPVNSRDSVNKTKYGANDSRSSVVEKPVLPNIASDYGHEGGMILMDDMDTYYVNTHPPSYPGEPVYANRGVNNTSIKREDSLIFRTRNLEEDPSTPVKPKDDNARLSFIPPHTYSDHRYARISGMEIFDNDNIAEREVVYDQTTPKQMRGVSNGEQNFVVPIAPPPPVAPPAPFPPPPPPPSPPPPGGSRAKNK
ncbi:uncharacterized protein LOC134266929 [Saccostrea cucullata]|uniref:uncharacterized protein LOC134266929 n=1 Tax=Saccostrea cuccullata TaxID=36930 RepID=UPI002ED038B9